MLGRQEKASEGGSRQRGLYARGCFGACRKKHPEFEGKAYARIDGELVACDSSKKLVKKMAAAIA